MCVSKCPASLFCFLFGLLLLFTHISSHFHIAVLTTRSSEQLCVCVVTLRRSKLSLLLRFVSFTQTLTLRFQTNHWRWLWLPQTPPLLCSTGDSAGKWTLLYYCAVLGCIPQPQSPPKLSHNWTCDFKMFQRSERKGESSSQLYLSAAITSTSTPPQL